MCKYSKSKKDLPFPRTLFISECGFKLMLTQGYNNDFNSDNFNKEIKPSGKCMKCGGVIKVIQPFNFEPAT